MFTRIIASLVTIAAASALLTPTRPVAASPEVDVSVAAEGRPGTIIVEVRPPESSPMTVRLTFESDEDVLVLDTDEPTVIIDGLVPGAEYAMVAEVLGEPGASVLPGITHFTAPTRELLRRLHSPNGDPARRNVSASGLSATLESCASQSFPFVFLGMRVDENSVPAPGIALDHFRCTENGVAQTDSFEVTPPDASGGVRLADIVFLIDASGSMDDEIAAVRNNAASFAAALAASNIDYRLGLVQFGNSTGNNPSLFDNGNLTADVGRFQSLVATLRASGAFEPGMLALRQAIQGFNFRPGAQKVFILITDEDSDGSDGSSSASTTERQQTIALLEANDVVVHAAVNCFDGQAQSHYCNATSVRGATGGLLFGVTESLTTILGTIAERTASTYILRYRSSNPAFDGTTRNVECTVDDGRSSASVTCSYTPGAAPRIELTPETRALLSTPQTAGGRPTVRIIVRDAVAPFVQSVTLWWRQTGAAVYATLTMAPHGGDLFQVALPPLSAPGIDFFVRATDGQLTSSLPSVDAGQEPFQIAVLPNVAPQIVHTPVTRAPRERDIPISAQVTDTTNRLVSVELLWRRVGELSYRRQSMTSTGSSTFQALIPAANVVSDIEYYLRATDDFGVASTAATADQPFVIAVTSEIVRDCPALPLSSCRPSSEPTRSKLELREPGIPDRRRLSFRTTLTTTPAGDFGDPLAGTTTTACIYRRAGSGDVTLVGAFRLPSGGMCGKRACWKSSRAGVFSYTDRDLTPDGVLRARLTAGRSGRARITLTGKGANLSLPTLPIAQTSALLVQVSSRTGNTSETCWEENFRTPFKRNSATHLRALGSFPPSPTPSVTATPTATRTPTTTRTATPTATPSATREATHTATATASLTATTTPTATLTSTNAATVTPTPQPATATPVPTVTPTSTATTSPLPTATPTATSSASPSPTTTATIPPTPTTTTTSTPSARVTASPTPVVAAACHGDCSGDGEVTVDEIVHLVSIALGDRAIADCSAGDEDGDGLVTVDEILRAIAMAMNACPAVP